MRHLITTLCVFTLFVTPPAFAQESEDLLDEVKLQEAGLSGDGGALLKFLQARSQAGVEPRRLAELTRQLGDKDADARSAACRELVALGPLAVPALRETASDPDNVPAAGLARKCLRFIRAEEGAALTAAAVRVLARRHPDGTVAALLKYLPFAESDESREAVKAALAQLARAGGEPRPALLDALANESPMVRAAAVEALCADGTPEPRDTLRKLLADPSPSVRLRAALALAHARDAKAVSTLIVLLGELPHELGREAEDFLLNLAGGDAPRTALGEDLTARRKARDAWAEWWLKSEGPGLLDEFRKRTMTEEARQECLALIRKLGDEDFNVREGASEKLKTRGVLVVPLLRQAVARDDDFEVRNRAKQCLQAIESKGAGPLPPQAARLIAYRKPAGAAEALLNFLPFADDEAVEEEVQLALGAVAYPDGKADPALTAALDDKLAIRRAAAAMALCQPGAGEKQLAAVRKLLADPDKSVRLSAALGLAGMKQRDAVPVLIGLIAELPADQASAADDYLTRVAGDAAPEGDPGTNAAARKKRSEAWAKWWKDNGDKARLVALHERPRHKRYLGFTLVISPNQSQVVELDRNGKVRWRITGMSNVWDAEPLGRDRFLFIESGANRMTERNSRGEILWQQRLVNIWPTSCQRLRNGNTFLVSGNRLAEVTREGKEVFSYNWPNGNILCARKLKNGQIVYVTSNGAVTRIDAKGKVVKNFNVPNPTNQGIDILDNGHIVYPQQHTNKVYEYDERGRKVWEATVSRPVSAQRLRNGNTLISTYSPFAVVELDRRGKEVWKATPPIQPLRAYRR